MLHLLDAGAPVETAQAALDRLAVGYHVGDAGWDAQVVLEYAEAVVGADDVGAADGRPRAVGRREAAHLQAVLGALHDHVLRYHTVPDNPAFIVNVVDEEVEGLETLGQPRLQRTPVVG